jgi:hypothetical protein
MADKLHMLLCVACCMQHYKPQAAQHTMRDLSPFLDVLLLFFVLGGGVLLRSMLARASTQPALPCQGHGA